MSFQKICRDIKTLKIQGATNVAKAGLKALLLKSDKESVRKLLTLRPTEPLLRNVVLFAQHDPERLGKFALAHITEAREHITTEAAKKVTQHVFTHCHSSTVIETLAHAKQQKKKFTVSCTETRPLYQGRKTAKDCRKLGLETHFSTDNAGAEALKHATVVLLGADAITPSGILNKIGSAMFTELAHNYQIPVYILADSWKYSAQEMPIEHRPSQEVWKQAPPKLIIHNQAFDMINPEHITGIISELGTHTHKEFLKQVPLMYPELYPKARGTKR